LTGYKIKIEPEAHQDIQEAIDWYNQQQPGLGRRFHTEVKVSFKKLEIHPFFQIRYDNVHLDNTDRIVPGKTVLWCQVLRFK